MTDARATAPTAAQIDAMGREYLEQEAICKEADEDLAKKRSAIVTAVNAWGSMPPRAEKSLRLEGSIYQLTVSQSDSTSINQAPAAALEEACRVSRLASLFRGLLRVEKKYVLQPGAQQALAERFPKGFPSPKRQRIRNLFARALRLKKGSPHVKVEPIEKPEGEKP